jgi:hypothetical protein
VCLLVILIGVFGLIRFYQIRSKKLDLNEKYATFESLIGEYQLDTLRTSLPEKDMNSNLELVLNRDSTFCFNKKTPYVLDSFGTWSSTGIMLDEANELVFTKKIRIPFTKLYLDNSDSLIHIIDMVSPKDGYKIQNIYFKKANNH